MKAIIIAAGRGKRMGDQTADIPKGLVKVGNTTLLENIISKLREQNINDIALIVGYQEYKIKEKIKNVTYFTNDNYMKNNILHSLMTAKSFMNDDVIISYSDIWLEQNPIKNLINTPSDCAISVDLDWKQNYIGRTEHPLTEAEMVIYSEDHKALKLGKNIEGTFQQDNSAEFIGLFKLSRHFCSEYTKIFDELNARLKCDEPFQNSKTWVNAYLTDFFNELIDRGHTIDCSFHRGGWQEIDTLQDYNRLCSRLMEDVGYAI